MSEDDDQGSLPAPDLGCSSNKAQNCDQVLHNVLENVLHFLTSRRDYNAVSLVCKSWYRADSLTRSNLFIRNCYAVSPRHATERFLRARSLMFKGKLRFADFNLMPPDWVVYFAPWVSAMVKAYTFPREAPLEVLVRIQRLNL